MRIVGGRLKGRVLATPASRDIRPTSERLRESMFDILEHRYPGRIEGARVIDLLRGVGSVGDRGACRAARGSRCLVDNGPEARALLRANVETLSLGGVTRIWRADATKLGAAPAGGPFALAFLDPPYERKPRRPRRSRRSSPAAGSSPMRSAWSRRRPRRKWPRRRAS